MLWQVDTEDSRLNNNPLRRNSLDSLQLLEALILGPSMKLGYLHWLVWDRARAEPKRPMYELIDDMIILFGAEEFSIHESEKYCCDRTHDE